MARKSKTQVEQDVYDAIADLFQGVTAAPSLVYQDGTRPRDSRSEDAVIIASKPSGNQFQEGRVRILVFIPDIDTGNGQWVRDIARIQDVLNTGIDEKILARLNEATGDEYSWEFFDGTGDGGDPDSITHEHFIDMHFKFTRETF